MVFAQYSYIAQSFRAHPAPMHFECLEQKAQELESSIDKNKRTLLFLASPPDLMIGGDSGNAEADYFFAPLRASVQQRTINDNPDNFNEEWFDRITTDTCAEEIVIDTQSEEQRAAICKLFSLPQDSKIPFSIKVNK